MKKMFVFIIKQKGNKTLKYFVNLVKSFYFKAILGHLVYLSNFLSSTDFYWERR